MALLLEAENARLHRRLGELTRALAQATGAAQAQLELEVARLQQQLAARTRALFGPSSERRGGGERADAPSAPAPPRGHGPRTQATLPLVEVVHTRSDAAAPCPQCGGTLEPWTGGRGDRRRRAELPDRAPPPPEVPLPVRRGRRHGAGAGEARARRPVLGRLRRRGRGGEVPRPSPARPPSAADGAGRPHGRHADALGPAPCVEPPSH